MATPSLLTLALTDVTTPILKDHLLAALSSPPFLHVPGTFNTRDLGLLPTATGRPAAIRPGFVFRSGGFPGGAFPDGGDGIRALGVKRIFDLRSVQEHAQQPDPEVDGVDLVWLASGEKEAVVGVGDFVEGEGEKGYVVMYLDVLKVYREHITRVLEHVRDRPGEGFLFHCTAGRDRTGVVAGLLLALAGADRDTIVLDFLLSRIGTEPAREHLLAFALKGSGAESVDTPGFYNLCQLRESCWDAFVRAVQRDYGGWDSYVTGTLGFSDEDLATIKRNLVAKD
ncbi:protein-tyrosine phosphatase-like protein [Lasiosphaeria hispida]|uniref:Protein-tyrosine phosphatase-like protein n=1 Tax=Lasiosphaeria hispida TaxID=260671 RepID=A0AAJ0HRD9_9PEZI|nr:protein-tyrosine phosphatase-like protein [Lasiosphaeria hispida]